MSRGGMVVPELADLIDRIAARIEAGEAKGTDWRFLRRLARQIRDDDPDWRVLVHQKRRGQRRKGAAGVDEQLDLARLVKAHRDERGGSLDDAYQAVSKRHGVNVGPDSIEKAWKEMRRVIDMDDGNRDVLLYFKRLKASGYSVNIKRKG